MEKRFEFGKNWQKFLKTLNTNKIKNAQDSLKQLFNIENFNDKTFLDIGSGSGLFSLSACKLGADEIFSFDYDEYSVESTKYLKKTYCKDANWEITRGDILSEDFLKNLKKYDFVYSWGVLHHTGNMYKALENTSRLVKDNGYLCVAIYNTQIQTPIWTFIKKTYVNSPSFIKVIMNIVFTIYFGMGLFLFDLIRFKNPFSRYKNAPRGMSLYTDVVDWIGGYPFETAKPEEIFKFFKKRGFVLENLVTVGGKMGCNEFVFKKVGHK